MEKVSPVSLVFDALLQEFLEGEIHHDRLSNVRSARI